MNGTAHGSESGAASEGAAVPHVRKDIPNDIKLMRRMCCGVWDDVLANPSFSRMNESPNVRRVSADIRDVILVKGELSHVTTKQVSAWYGKTFSELMVHSHLLRTDFSMKAWMGMVSRFHLLVMTRMEKAHQTLEERVEYSSRIAAERGFMESLVIHLFGSYKDCNMVTKDFRLRMVQLSTQELRMVIHKLDHNPILELILSASSEARKRDADPRIKEWMKGCFKLACESVDDANQFVDIEKTLFLQVVQHYCGKFDAEDLQRRYKASIAGRKGHGEVASAASECQQDDCTLLLAKTLRDDMEVECGIMEHKDSAGKFTSKCIPYVLAARIPTLEAVSTNAAIPYKEDFKDIYFILEAALRPLVEDAMLLDRSDAVRRTALSVIKNVLATMAEFSFTDVFHSVWEKIDDAVPKTLQPKVRSFDSMFGSRVTSDVLVNLFTDVFEEQLRETELQLVPPEGAKPAVLRKFAQERVVKLAESFTKLEMHAEAIHSLNPALVGKSYYTAVGHAAATRSREKAGPVDYVSMHLIPFLHAVLLDKFAQTANDEVLAKAYLESAVRQVSAVPNKDEFMVEFHRMFVIQLVDDADNDRVTPTERDKRRKRAQDMLRTMMQRHSELHAEVKSIYDMLDDYEPAMDSSRRFLEMNNAMHGAEESEGRIVQLTALVFHPQHFPAYRPWTNSTFPQDLNTAREGFEQMYAEQHAQHRIMWMRTGSEACTFSIQFPRGTKRIVATLDLAVMFHAVNKGCTGRNHGATIKEISAMACMPEDTVMKALPKFAHGMMQLLCAVNPDGSPAAPPSGKKTEGGGGGGGGGADTETTVLYSINPKFAHRDKDIPLVRPPPLLQGSKEDQDLLQQRITTVVATITRWMKKERNIAHAELMDKVARDLSDKLLVTSRLFKLAVENCLERDILKRDTEDLDMYIYVP